MTTISTMTMTMTSTTTKAPLDFPTYLATCHTRVQQALTTFFNQHVAKGTAPRLADAMRYATLSGGKRLRPALVYATGHACGAPAAVLDTPACAVELIHSYSLIHDDLPAMDNDDLRRGQASCHRAFDEATAILAGDALQSFAFEILTAPHTQLTPAQQLAMTHTLAKASGAQGMVAGQANDLAATTQKIELNTLEHIHQQKTGALIAASVRCGALACATITEAQLTQLEQYAQAIGLAFQIQDDVLDVVSNSATLGKPQGSDAEQHKTTYVDLLGLAAAQHQAQQLCQQAIDALSGFDERADRLRHLAQLVSTREK